MVRSCLPRFVIVSLKTIIEIEINWLQRFSHQWPLVFAWTFDKKHFTKNRGLERGLVTQGACLSSTRSSTVYSVTLCMFHSVFCYSVCSAMYSVTLCIFHNVFCYSVCSTMYSITLCMFHNVFCYSVYVPQCILLLCVCSTEYSVTPCA